MNNVQAARKEKQYSLQHASRVEKKNFPFNLEFYQRQKTERKY